MPQGSDQLAICIAVRPTYVLPACVLQHRARKTDKEELPGDGDDGGAIYGPSKPLKVRNS